MNKKLPLLLVLALFARLCFADDQSIDWKRAQELHRKEIRGETLSADDRAYLERAKQQFQQHRQKVQANSDRASENVPKHFVPITELLGAYNGTYQGRTGGLYGDGRNEPPQQLQAAAQKQTAAIRALDKAGRPSESGKIVLLSLGMSNTTQEFSRFRQVLRDEKDLSPDLVVVDGAQGGQDARITSQESAKFWNNVDERLQQSGVSPKQVQVVWLKQAVVGGCDISQLEDYLNKIVAIAKKRFPNLRIIYLSSRIYAGYATTHLNPEPYAYESVFAVRDLILKQTKGEMREPLLLWGPYLWADGNNPRKSDGLAWKPEDFGPDGTHPGDSGREKVAKQLLNFFKTDLNTRKWFLRSGS